MPATTTRSATGRFGSSFLPRKSTAEGRRAEGEGSGVRLGEVREEVPHPLPEVAVGALEPEQLRKLRAGQVEGDPGLEAGHDRLGDEAHEASGAEGPGPEGHHGHDEGGGGGERGEARRVAAGDVPEGRAHDQRDRGGDRDRGVPRAAEEPEHETGEEAGVQAGLGGQAREGGVADAGGDADTRRGRRPRSRPRGASRAGTGEGDASRAGCRKARSSFEPKRDGPRSHQWSARSPISLSRPSTADIRLLSSGVGALKYSSPWKMRAAGRSRAPSRFPVAQVGRGPQGLDLDARRAPLPRAERLDDRSQALPEALGLLDPRRRRPPCPRAGPRRGRR